MMDDNDTWLYGVYHSIDKFWDEQGDSAALVLIDIPIGIPSAQRRTADSEARRVLGDRSSSVFDVPMRPALSFAAEGGFGSEYYAEACVINREVCGWAFSRQTWAIMPRIHEVDQFMRHNVKAQKKVKEIHPEVLFWALSGEPMKYNKKSGLGFYERVMILERYLPNAVEIIETIYDAHHHDLGDDDIVDALAASLSAKLGHLAWLPERVEKDQYGLPMQIVYPRIENLPKLNSR